MPRSKLNILYVGNLPPQSGGSTVSWSQLLVGFVRLGHPVRALAPITPEALRGGDSFAVKHPEIAVERFLVPYFNSAVNVPALDEYRRLMDQQIRAILPRLISDKRPDILIAGRETYALHVPDLARAHLLRCILGIRGSTTMAILNQTYPEAATREMLEQYRKVTLLVSAANHMAEGLRQLGFKNITVVPNAIDFGQFSPSPKDPELLRALAIRDDEIIVMHVSNLKTVKRPLDIVGSAERALRHNPKLVYVIVGDGLLRAAMEEACLQKGLSERFRFVGWGEDAPGRRGCRAARRHRTQGERAGTGPLPGRCHSRVCDHLRGLGGAAQGIRLVLLGSVSVIPLQ